MSVLSRALLLLALPCWPIAPLAAEVERWQGYAYDLDTQALVYSETHERRYESGQLLAGKDTYLDPEGALIAEKELRFEHPTAPIFTLDDQRIQYREGLKREAAGWVTFKMEPGSGKLQEAPVTLEGEPVADAGFDRYILQEWNALLAGERRTFDFIVPSQLRAIRFRVEKVGEENRQGRALVHMELKPDGFLLRNLVSPIQLYYDRDTRQLAEYQGISNVRKLNGKGYKVRIEFPAKEFTRTAAATPCEQEPCS